MNDVLSDEQLMERFVWHNDTESFEALVLRWDERVFAFLVKASGDRDAAKDLRQDVFIRVHRYAATFDSEQAFSTWLFSIVRNVLATWYAKKKRAGQLGSSDHNGAAFFVSASPTTPASEAMRAEDRDRVDRVISRLKPEERELILLRMDLDMSYREIGEILNAAESTIKSRMYKEFRPAGIPRVATELGPCERIE